MKKGVLLCVLLALSGVGQAAEKVYTGPDCSKDMDFRMIGGITDSFNLGPEGPASEKTYFKQLIGKNIKRTVTRLSSEKISKVEAKRLMFRRAKRDGIDKNSKELKAGGSYYTQYMTTDLYRQYYLIKTSAGFKAIAEYYSAYNPGNWPVGTHDAEACGADLENIYIISDTLDGHTADFATR